MTHSCRVIGLLAASLLRFHRMKDFKGETSVDADRQIRCRRCAKLALEIDRREHTVREDFASRLWRKTFEHDCADLIGTPEYEDAMREELAGQSTPYLPATTETVEDPVMEIEIVQPVASPSVRASLRSAALSTPLARLHHCLQRAGVPWHDDDRDPVKAYIFACLSELAYLHLTEHELKARDRYKLFMPSIANAELRRVNMRIDIQLFADIGDFGIEVFDTVDYVYVVMRIQGAWVVAVRGTHSLGDLIVDLRARKITTNHGRFHRGFAREALIALPLLEQHIDNDWPIYFTGHSMGAAVAVILSHEWNGPSRVMTPYLFAVPRYADRSMTDQRPIYNYVRPWDMIPHVPPKVLRYAGTAQDQLVVPQGSKQHGALLCTLVTLDQLFATHSIEGYRTGLGREVAHLMGHAFGAVVYIDRLIKDLNGRALSTER